MTRSPLPALLAALALAGCGTTSNVYRLGQQPAGMSDAALRSFAGEPQAAIKHADGTRSLVYSTQPGGTECFLVTQDAEGKLVSVENTLSEAGREKIVRGMTRESVLQRLCQPIERLLTAHPYEILSWNMEPLSADQPRRFDVYFQNGQVHHTEVRTLYFQSVN